MYLGVKNEIEISFWRNNMRRGHWTVLNGETMEITEWGWAQELIMPVQHRYAKKIDTSKIF